MRVLGLSLVILSLCLSTGGVALESLAGPEQAAKASAAADEASPQCQVQKPQKGWKAEVRIPDRSAKGGRSFVPLNGQGYNYGEPGAWRPPVANGHTPPPAGVPKRESVPAAPAPEK